MNFFQKINLISRLSVSRKLVLIYALDLSAVIFVSTILVKEKYLAIDFAGKEIVGNDYISAVREAAFGALANQSPEQAAEQVLAAELRYGNAYDGMGSQDPARGFAEMLRNRQANSAFSGSGTNAKSVGQASQELITRIGNQSNLILDPDLDSYYTMSLVVIRFPELYDLIGRVRQKVRDASAAAMVDKALRQTEYLILEGRLDAIARGIASDYSEAMQAGKPELRMELDPSRRALLAAIDTFRGNANRIAIAGIRSELDEPTEELFKQLHTSWMQAGVSLGDLLQRRIDSLFERMWLHMGTAAGLLLVILSVVFFVARQIVVPLRRLARVAESVRSSGDYTLRASWHSRDEIGILVNAFNAMLAQLDHSRLVEQEMAAQTRAAKAQRDLLEAMPIPMMVTSIPRHEILHTNAPAQDWIEGKRSDPWLTGLMPEARLRFFQQLSDTGEANEFEALWFGEKSRSWVLLSARRLFYQGCDAVLTAFTPISRLKQMEKRLELWAKVFEASSESIMITDQDRCILTANRAFCRSINYDLAELIGLQPGFLSSDRHPDGFYHEVWQAAAIRGFWQGEMWLQRKTGESFPVWAVLNAVRNESGRITNFIAASLDISERKANEQRINYLAQHDVLTELPNRALCIERLRMALQNAERQKRRVGVLFIDLDRFKNINDSLGHHVGDGLLRSVSHRLQEVVRAGDTVSRLAGDEFIVILGNVADSKEIVQVVDHRLIPLIREPHDVDGAELHISCSIGIAVYPEDGTDIDTLMRNADTAMYQAKSLGRNKAEFFTIDMDRRARERMSIENDLRVALSRGELHLYYQPRIDCRSGKLIGAEALLRWQHPEQGLISPARFVPVAEESGLIVPIGAWVLNEACRQQAAWRRTGYTDIVLSVNISVIQLHDPNLYDTLFESLRRHEVSPSLIELELTESLLMEHVASTIELLHAIKGLGVLLSIDDFGTGYSSLNYLHRFPIDKLKIDQSFVNDMLVDPNDLAITKAVIGLGHILGLRVVAEGVEKTEEMQVLSAAGCDELQGYLFGKPMPVAEFEDWRSSYSVERRRNTVLNLVAD